MVIDSLVARFGGSAISNSSTLQHANATLMTYVPRGHEHEILYHEVVKRLCKGIHKFPMGYGRVWVFPKTLTVGLVFKLPSEVQSILREMSKALPSVEGIKMCEDLMVPVWHASSTEQTFSAALSEVWAFRNLLSAAYPHGVRLGLARGLNLWNRADSETTPRSSRSFIDPPGWEDIPTPENTKIDMSRPLIHYILR